MCFVSGLQTAVSVAERPITQQGLTGLKTSSGGRGPQRQFQVTSGVFLCFSDRSSELGNLFMS